VEELPVVQVNADVFLPVRCAKEDEVPGSHLGLLYRVAPIHLLPGRAREADAKGIFVKRLRKR
jgi:hypothetical protein